VNNELEGTRKVAVIAYYEGLSRHLSGENEKDQEEPPPGHTVSREWGLIHLPTRWVQRFSSPCRGQDRPWGLQAVEAARFQENKQAQEDGNIVSPTYRYLHSPGNIPGIATRYGLDVPGIESRWRWDFPHALGSDLGPTQPPVRWVAGHSRG